MQAGSMVRTFSRFATRPVLLAVIAVAAAMIALALLAEAMNGGGGTVYLAQIDAGQQTSGVPSLVAVGYGTATVPAESALMQLLISNGTQFDGGYVPPTPDATPGALEHKAAEPVVAAIVKAGVPSDAVQVVVSSAFGNLIFGNPEAARFRIDVTLNQPNLETMNAVVDAAAQAANQGGYSIESVGALYGVADCSAVRNQAWESAVDDARASAEHQASLLGVKLGDLLTSQEALSDPADTTGTAAISGVCTQSDPPISQYPFIEFDITTPRFEPNREPVAAASTRVSLAFEIVRD